jgi:DNA-directed RNA polymerase specialized sigma24 family protein
VQTEETHDWQRCVAAVQANADPNLVNTAIIILRPLVEETALRICRRRMVREQLRLDFVAGSVAEVFAPRESRDGIRRSPRISEYNPADGAFAGWLFKVLDNLLKDQLRTTGRRATREATFSSILGDSHVDQPPIVGAEESDPSIALDRASPFTTRDIESLGYWPALDRVLVLAVFELRQKLPPTTWRSWCQEASLPTPFPPEHKIPHDRGDWINLIAELLALSPNALQNRIRRRLEQLRSEPLDYIQGIQHGK